MNNYTEQMILPMTYLLAQAKGFDGILPSQAVLAKWLREEKRMNISISRAIDLGSGYNWEGYDERGDQTVIMEGSMVSIYEDYEDAYEAALNAALQRLTNVCSVIPPEPKKKLLARSATHNGIFSSFFDKVECWALRMTCGDLCIHYPFELYEPPLKDIMKIGHIYYMHIGKNLYLQTKKSYAL